MLNIQKFASDWTGLGYGLSSSNTASSSTTVFVPLANKVKIENNEIKTELARENLDKGKSILGAPPKLEKKYVKIPKAKKTKKLEAKLVQVRAQLERTSNVKLDDILSI